MAGSARQIAPRWLAGPGIIRADLRAGRGRAGRGRRSRRASPRRRPAARPSAGGAPGRRSARRPRRRWRSPRAGSTRHDPAAAGTRSATTASNVAIARASRSSSSSPSCAGGVGDEVADAPHRPLRGVVMPGPARPATIDGAVRRRRGPPTSGRSSTQRRIEVVEGRRRDERLGQLRDPPDEVRPPVRVELAEDVVEQEEGRAAVELGQQVELGQLEREDRRALLAARGEAGESRGRRGRRPGRRGAGRSTVEPFQTSFSAVSTSRRARASRGVSPRWPARW